MTEPQRHFGLIVLLFLAGTLAALQYAKLPWMIPGLQSTVPMTLLEQATLLSFIGVAGVLAGTVATPILSRFGFFRSLKAGLLVAAIGSAWPLMFHQSHTLLLVGRGIESAAHIAIVISVPTLILRIAASGDQPRAMTLWSTYFTFTFIVTALSAPYLLEAFGWRSLAIIHAFMCAIIAGTLTLFATFLQANRNSTDIPSIPALSFASVAQIQWQLISTQRLRVIPLAFLGYTLLFVALVSTLPQTMSSENWSTARLALLFPTISVCGAVIVSIALARGRQTPSIIRTSAIALLAVSMLLLIVPLSHPLSLPLMMLGFLIMGTLPGGILSSIPAIFDGNDPDVAIVSGGLVQFGNLGNFIGPPGLALLTQQTGIHATGLYLCLGAFIILVALRPLNREVELVSRKRKRPT